MARIVLSIEGEDLSPDILAGILHDHANALVQSKNPQRTEKPPLKLGPTGIHRLPGAEVTWRQVD